MAIDNNYRQGTALPTTYVYDVDEIDIESEGFKELIVRLQQDTNRIILALNRKIDGSHFQTVFNTGALFFASSNASNTNDNMRPIFTTTVIFGALPNASIKSVAHNIPPAVLSAGLWTLVGWQISATLPNTTSVPIPGFDPTDITKPINAWFDKTNVNIQTTSNMSTYTICYVTFTYILS
jgi:hypothetical protein